MAQSFRVVARFTPDGSTVVDHACLPWPQCRKASLDKNVADANHGVDGGLDNLPLNWHYCNMTQMNNNQEATPEPASSCGAGLSALLSPRLFKALADPTRLSLLVRLAEAGSPATVSQLADGSGVDMSVVSRHLAVLREAGIIACTRQGKEVYCRMHATAVTQILRDLAAALEACCPEDVCPVTLASSPVAAKPGALQPAHSSQI